MLRKLTAALDLTCRHTITAALFDRNNKLEQACTQTEAILKVRLNLSSVWTNIINFSSIVFHLNLGLWIRILENIHIKLSSCQEIYSPRWNGIRVILIIGLWKETAADIMLASSVSDCFHHRRYFAFMSSSAGQCWNLSLLWASQAGNLELCNSGELTNRNELHIFKTAYMRTEKHTP